MINDIVLNQLKSIHHIKKHINIQKELAKVCIRKEFQQNDILIKQGDSGSSLYILTQGVVSASLQIDNENIIIHEFQAPCRFGERTCFRNDEICPCSCKVTSKVAIVYELPALELVRILGNSIFVPLEIPNNSMTMYGIRKKKDVVCYKGIRYGKARRFEPPQLCGLPSNSCLRVLRGPSAPQVSSDISQHVPFRKIVSQPHNLVFLATKTTPGTSMIGIDHQMQSEDCLQLTVYSPSKSPDAIFPVMVFIHGGAFVNGSGADVLYEATDLSANGVVVVLINYRLGPLGFIEAPNVASNLGLQDQLTALMWVQNHISLFGGDRDNVTVFGESAGAMSVGCLLGSEMRFHNPINRVLFHKAIPQSGAALNAISHAQGEKSAALFAQHLGLTLENLHSEIHKIPLHEVVIAGEKVGLASVKRDDLYGKFMAFQPVVSENIDLDPVFRGKDPAVAIATGIAKDVRVFIGTTKDEYALFMTLGLGGEKSLARDGMLRSSVLPRFSARIESYLNDESRYVHVADHHRRAHLLADQLLPPGDTAGRLTMKDIREAVENFFSIWLFTLPCLRLAQTQQMFNQVFLYRVDFESPVARLKACHAIELPLLFGSYKHRLVQFLTGTGKRVTRVSDSIQLAWTSFAKTGTPRTLDIPEWPPFDLKSRHQVLLGAKSDGGDILDTMPLQFIHEWSGICISKI